jgi:hypothetical protein
MKIIMKNGMLFILITLMGCFSNNNPNKKLNSANEKSNNTIEKTTENLKTNPNEYLFSCKSKTLKINLPKIIKQEKIKYTEGTLEFLITKDSVIIEFNCGGNYVSKLLQNKDRYKILTSLNGVLKGVDNKNNSFWRREGRLIYSNAKAKDTIKYNTIFNEKIIIKE